MKIFLAMAEFDDGNRIFERAYKTYAAADDASKKIVEDITSNTDWKVQPLVEDLDLIDE